jgi:putative transposase
MIVEVVANFPRAPVPVLMHVTTISKDVREQAMESLPLPKGWSKSVRSAILNVIGLVRIAMMAGREFLHEEGEPRLARIHRLEAEVAMLREEMRVKDARMARIDPHRRPQYAQTEPMAILEIRTIRGWNKTETGRRFLVSDDTIRTWLRRADDDTLIQTQVPVNRFPDIVRYAVQRIKLFCPTLGKVKIAQMLARAGVHIGKTTVGRILKERPTTEPEPPSGGFAKRTRIVAKYPSHIWHADLTAVPISGGYWTRWVPNSLWQRWPVCWWVFDVVDHFSRRSMGIAAFKAKPSSEEVTAALDRIMAKEQVRPKYLIVDQGRQFKCDHFEWTWCPAMNIRPRFGAVGRHGSIAVVECFHRTFKECFGLTFIPEDQSEFEWEASLILDWYDEHRPHTTLGGKTPNEVYFSHPPANQESRLEPRPNWPRGSPCAKPSVDIDGEPGYPIVLDIDCLEGRPHLPIVRAQRAA